MRSTGEVLGLGHNFGQAFFKAEEAAMPPLPTSGVVLITVNRNDRAGLARTLDSVARQTYRDREAIVIDGASTDGSVDVIRERAGTVTDWISEPDGGIYDAMNKGIRRARGTYLVFMNGGDSFASDDALERFLAAGEPKEDLLYSDAVIEHEDGTTHVWKVPERLDWDYFMLTSLPHQSSAFRRDLFERVGLYDTRFRIGGDHELYLRAVVVHGATFRKVPVPLARQVWGGLSNRPESYRLLREERRLAKERALGPILLAHWEEYVAAKRGFVHHTVRTGFRPMARRMRALTRRLRGKPDSEV
jgi:glycosyltransferase involved in cell wall biosynthesis